MRRLPDGTPVLLRRIRPDDKEFLARALRMLSDRSVQRRFLTSKRTYSSSELRYLTEVDGRNHVAVVAESLTVGARRVIGVARFVRWRDSPDAAEAAIEVADDWQGRGLGSLLARELARRARGVGVKRFTATMAADNVPAHRLMQKLSAHLEERHDGTLDELVTDLAA
jgi:RimJ/RimL family protein N-acetyltransferase